MGVIYKILKQQRQQQQQEQQLEKQLEKQQRQPHCIHMELSTATKCKVQAAIKQRQEQQQLQQQQHQQQQREELQHEDSLAEQQLQQLCRFLAENAARKKVSYRIPTQSIPMLIFASALPISSVSD